MRLSALMPAPARAAGEQVLGLDRGGGVRGVAVGADRVGVLLGDGAPPTMTITSSRRPAFSSALMLALNIGIVVVRNAEKPTMSGWCSSIAATNFSGATCTPRSITSKPAPSSMMLTRFLPMSWTSPLTVPMRNLPTVSTPVSASSGRSTSIAPAIARPAISISGTKKSPRSKRAPTSSSDGISASKSSVCGSIAMPSACGSARARGARCRPASRRRGPGGSPRCHATPSFAVVPGRVGAFPPSRSESCSAASASSAPVARADPRGVGWGRRPRGRR